MGAVYLAVQDVLQRRVALKLLRRELLAEPKVMRRFEREARAASRIDHPNITAVYDFGYSEEGVPYLVMEYVQGPTLSAVITEQGPFAPGRALHVLSQIASAVHAAHQADVVHRDLKPQNIVLYTREEQPDFVKVLDFGTSKILGPDGGASLTTQGTSLGTPAYMAPEQLVEGQEQVDHRADLYSLGVVAFEMLVGRPPFVGALMEVMKAHVGQPPPAPSEAAERDEIPPELDQLVLCCLAKSPDARYCDAAELCTAIEALRS
jgi:serine/threonine protein kinase